MQFARPLVFLVLIGCVGYLLANFYLKRTRKQRNEKLDH